MKFFSFSIWYFVHCAIQSNIGFQCVLQIITFGFCLYFFVIRVVFLHVVNSPSKMWKYSITPFWVAADGWLFLQFCFFLPLLSQLAVSCCHNPYQSFCKSWLYPLLLKWPPLLSEAVSVWCLATCMYGLYGQAPEPGWVDPHCPWWYFLTSSW